MLTDPHVRLEGKRILVTGGTMGIGLAAARICLQSGGQVVLGARHAGGVEEAVARLRAEGLTQVSGVAVDVACLDDVERALDHVEAGGGPLTSVIHAAGVYGPIGPVTEVDPQAWWEALRTNLFGAFLVTRQSCRRLQRTGGGRIVLFSGGGAGSAFPCYSSYASAKVAVARFAESTAIEMAPHRIAINCVGPGFVATRLHQQTLAVGEHAGADFLEKTRRELANGGVPPEVGGAAAAFLISEAAVGITGKFVAAPYDGWRDWPQHLEDLVDSDLFTLRRIVPKDRGGAWQ